MRRTATAVLCTAAVAALAACAPAPVERDTPPPAPGAIRATANVAPASASLVSGTLQLMPMADGVHVTGELGGLAPGPHGFHVHERGDCSAADASSAGGHFNPTNMPHGRSGPNPHHLGDSDNIVANANRVATVNAHLHDVTLGTGLPNDIAGRAIVVHADPDDYTSQPSGDAGSRVACGVISVIR